MVPPMPAVATLSDDERKRWMDRRFRGKGDSGGGCDHVRDMLPAVELSALPKRPVPMALWRNAAACCTPTPMAATPTIRHSQRLNKIPHLCTELWSTVGHTDGSLVDRPHVQRFEQVQYTKEETLPEPIQLAVTLKFAGDACRCL